MGEKIEIRFDGSLNGLMSRFNRLIDILIGCSQKADGRIDGEEWEQLFLTEATDYWGRTNKVLATCVPDLFVAVCGMFVVLSVCLSLSHRLPIPGDGWHRYVPEPICRVVNRPGEAALWWQIGCQRRQRLCIITGVIGELDCYGFGRALRNSVVQVFDSPLGLYALVVADKPYSFGQTCRRTDFSIEGTIYESKSNQRLIKTNTKAYKIILEYHLWDSS